MNDHIHAAFTSHFDNEVARFSGATGESFTITLDEFDTVCQTLKLPRRRKLGFLFHALQGHAYTFFRQSCEKQANHYEHAVMLMEVKYSGSVQDALHRELQGMRLREVMYSQGLATDEAMSWMLVRIEELEPADKSVSACLNFQMRNYLWDAVASEVWTLAARTQAIEESWMLRDLHRTLCEDWKNLNPEQRNLYDSGITCPLTARRVEYDESLCRTRKVRAQEQESVTERCRAVQR